jgi:hypothetical protein
VRPLIGSVVGLVCEPSLGWLINLFTWVSEPNGAGLAVGFRVVGSTIVNACNVLPIEIVHEDDGVAVSVPLAAANDHFVVWVELLKLGY